jgi:hypothetical protein
MAHLPRIFTLAVMTKAWQLSLSRQVVDGERVSVIGYCMSGRLGIHFVAATPQVRSFVGYYPTVRDNPNHRVTSRSSVGRGEKVPLPVNHSRRQRRCGYNGVATGQSLESIPGERTFTTRLSTLILALISRPQHYQSPQPSGNVSHDFLARRLLARSTRSRSRESISARKEKRGKTFISRLSFQIVVM